MTPISLNNALLDVDAINSGGGISVIEGMTVKCCIIEDEDFGYACQKGELMFTSLHQHSMFSTLDGYGTPEMIIARAKEAWHAIHSIDRPRKR